MNSSQQELRAESLSIHFGGLQAIFGLSFSVLRHEILSIIGPNGAGKTSAINLITGIYIPTSGAIYFRDQELTGRKPFQIASIGIKRTFQNVQIFPNMNVRENVMVGMHSRTHAGFLRCFLHTPMVRREEAGLQKRTDEVLDFMGLSSRAETPASGLPYGEQKRLEIARCLSGRPELLLLDEPVAGLNPQETEAMSEMILKIRAMGITIVLVEHDMNLVMRVSDRIIVLHYGQKLAEGTPEEIQEDPKVIDAYLGKGI